MGETRYSTRLQRVRVIPFFASVVLAGVFVAICREALLPTARLLAMALRLGDSVTATGAAFVLIGALFAATGRAPERKDSAYPLDGRSRWLSLIVPLALGLVYGAWHPDLPLWRREGILESVLWYVVAVPVAEELVFRGGLYGALLRAGGDRPMTATNPLPVAVWASAAAFALWHWDAGPWTVGRTFFLGLWLGWLRWRTGPGLRWPVLGHVLVNGAAILL